MSITRYFAIEDGAYPRQVSPIVGHGTSLHLPVGGADSEQRVLPAKEVKANLGPLK